MVWNCRGSAFASCAAQAVLKILDLFPNGSHHTRQHSKLYCGRWECSYAAVPPTVGFRDIPLSTVWPLLHCSHFAWPVIISFPEAHRFSVEIAVVSTIEPPTGSLQPSGTKPNFATRRPGVFKALFFSRIAVFWSWFRLLSPFRGECPL